MRPLIYGSVLVVIYVDMKIYQFQIIDTLITVYAV